VVVDVEGVGQQGLLVVGFTPTPTLPLEGERVNSFPLGGALPHKPYLPQKVCGCPKRG